MSTDLLQDFLGDEVSVLTDMKSAVETPDGNVAEIPLIIEGIILDYDEEYLLIGSTESSTPELIHRDHIVNIKIIDHVLEELRDPSRPDKKDMN